MAGTAQAAPPPDGAGACRAEAPAAAAGKGEAGDRESESEQLAGDDVPPFVLILTSHYRTKLGTLAK